MVCDQIANKSFVVLNASILGKYRKKTSLRSASQAQRQNSVTGRHEQVLEGLKIYFETKSVDQKTKFFIAKFHKNWSRPQKRSSTLHLEICANFHQLRGETTKKSGTERQFSLTNSGMITSIFGVSGLELHSNGTEPVTFFGAQS